MAAAHVRLFLWELQKLPSIWDKRTLVLNIGAGPRGGDPHISEIFYIFCGFAVNDYTFKLTIPHISRIKMKHKKENHKQ